MSILKQSVYQIVAKNETVVNGYDAGNQDLEGAVFQCNYSPIDYSPATFRVDGGNNFAQGDIVRWTFDLANGSQETVAFEIQGDYELVKALPITVDDTSGTAGKTADDTFLELSLFDSQEDLYKFESKFFTRNYTTYNPGGTALASSFVFGQNGKEESIVGPNIAAFTPSNIGNASQFKVSEVIPVLYDSTSTGSIADVIWANSGEGLRRFQGKKYYGVVDATSVVPHGAWFYYDGAELFNGALLPADATAIGPGFFQNNTTVDLDFSDSSNPVFANAIFYDQVTIDATSVTNFPNAGGAGYVLAGDGTSSGQFKLSESINVVTAQSQYSEIVDGVEYSSVSSTNGLWTLSPAFSSPLVNINQVPVDGNALTPNTFSGTFQLEGNATSTTVSIESNTAGAAADIVLTGDGTSTIGALATAGGATVTAGDDTQVLQNGQAVTLTGGLDATPNAVAGTTFPLEAGGTSTAVSIESNTAGAAADIALTGDGTSTIGALATAGGATVTAGDDTQVLQNGQAVTLTGGLDATPNAVAGTTFPLESGPIGTAVTVNSNVLGPAADVPLTGDGSTTIADLATAANAVLASGIGTQVLKSGQIVNLTGGSSTSNVTDSSVLDIVPANDLTNSIYWDKISQNFVEDYDVALGTGVGGADPAGLYTVGGTLGTATDTYQTLEINSRVNGTATQNFKITTSARHGIPGGASAEVTIAGFAGGDAALINSPVGGTTTVLVVDETQLEVVGHSGATSTAQAVTDAITGEQLITKVDYTDNVWKLVDLPTTSAGLIYRP